MKKGAEELTFPLKGKYLAMLAPSFVVDFSYPKIISQLKNLGFSKVVELTFGAKMINRDYHKILKKSRDLVISSVCPGVVETIRTRFPKYKKNLIKVDSPMAAMAKICRKNYPEYKIVFIAPCNYKKIEAQNMSNIDYVIDFRELKEILSRFNAEKNNKKDLKFDSFYNDYTKIYPVSGGLSKTAHIKNIISPEQTKIIDGIAEVMKFLENPDKNIRFLDATFCMGGCIGGPAVTSKLPILLRKKRIMNYMKIAKKESIPKEGKGNVQKAKGVYFKSNYPSGGSKIRDLG